MRVITDLAYGPSGPGNLLDIYRPEAGDEAPTVIWSGGSGWMRDDGRETAAAIAPFFTDRGYAVVGVSVRSTGEATFPAQLDDARAAVEWVRAHAAEHGIDPDRLVTMGNSSGGWFAVMAALHSGGAVAAAVDLYGPTDFLAMDAHMVDGGAQFNARVGITGGHADPASPESRLLGGPIEERPDECARANPITHVAPGAPPLLILHGQADPIVPHHQSELLFDAMTVHGNAAVFYSVPRAGHEHGYLADPALAAGYVVRETRDGVARTLDDAPPPTWEAIERFIERALAR